MSVGAVVIEMVQMDLTALSLSPHDRVLHYPCGNGVLVGELAAKVPLGIVVGLDSSDDHVRAARAAHRDLDNAMFVTSDRGEIPWKEDFFSHVILGNRDLPMKEVERVLAEGGCAMLESGEVIAVKERPTTPAGFHVLN